MCWHLIVNGTKYQALKHVLYQWELAVCGTLLGAFPQCLVDGWQGFVAVF